MTDEIWIKPVGLALALCMMVQALAYYCKVGSDSEKCGLR